MRTIKHPSSLHRSRAPSPGVAGTRLLLRSSLALTMALLVGCSKSQPEPETKPSAANQPAAKQQAAVNPPAEAPVEQPIDSAPLWPADQNKAATQPDRTTFIPLEPAPSDTASQTAPSGATEPANPLRSGSTNVRPQPPTTAEAPAETEPSTLPLATIPDEPETKTGPATEEAAALSPSAPPKKREPLFEGWSKPVFALMLTGQQQGYIEPCGCTGLANQKGGLARRHTFLKDLRETKGWDVVPLDVGNQVRRSGIQSQIKFAHTADGLRAMRYGGVAFGGDDLGLSVDPLYVATLNPDDGETIFLSANVALLSRDFQPTLKVIKAGGKKIGVTAVLGPQHEAKLQEKGDIIHEAPLKALKAAAAALQSQKCDYYVLLAHASLEETKSLAKDVPIFDLVVTSGGYGEPTFELEKIDGTKSLLAQVGTKGMYTGVVGFFNDKQDPIRYERVPLDDRFDDSPEMLQLLADYQQQLEQMGLEELGVRPQQHPSGYKFVGSETCGECHTKAFAVWQETPHAHATQSLVKPPNARGDIARHFDPECLSCHVTGWEPQKFYPFESGYLSLQDTPHLQHNGCENCHGPGSAHVAAENGEGNPSAATIAERRSEMRLPLAGGVAERKCMECHDLDNSPDFHVEGAFEKYWKQVEHKGKD